MERDCENCKFKNDGVNKCVRRNCFRVFNPDERLNHLDAFEPENVNHPLHYQGKHECIDEMIELFGIDDVIGFCKCNVYKYRYRTDRKNGAEDIEKADWYMDKLIELQKNER